MVGVGGARPAAFDELVAVRVDSGDEGGALAAQDLAESFPRPASVLRSAPPCLLRTDPALLSSPAHQLDDAAIGPFGRVGVLGAVRLESPGSWSTADAGGSSLAPGLPPPSPHPRSSPRALLGVKAIAVDLGLLRSGRQRVERRLR